MREVQLDSEKIFDGKIFKVRRDKVELEDGTKSMREVVYHNGGGCVVAITDNNEVLLVRQFRYAYGEEIYEIPAGKIEIGEDPMDCARRELQEETGYACDRIEPLTVIYPTPGYTSEKIRIFRAYGLHFVAQHLDPGEFLEVVKMPVDEAIAKIYSGEIKDSKTIVGILMATDRR